MAHCNLGKALLTQGKLAEAEAAYRQSLRFKPDYAPALDGLASFHAKEALERYNEGVALAGKKDWPAAEVAFRAAVRLNPRYVNAYDWLGIVLRDQRKYPAAVAAHRAAIGIQPEYEKAHLILGITLQEQGKMVDAEAAFRETVRLKPDWVTGHLYLGDVLMAQKKYPDAAAAYRAATEASPADAPGYYGLGIALDNQGDLPAAEAAFREAIRLSPTFAAVYSNLGLTLRKRGQFEASRDAYRRSHELGSKLPGWRYPSEKWVRDAERFVEFDNHLPDVLVGKATPVDSAGYLEFVVICQFKRHYAAASRLYGDAFELDASLVKEPAIPHRYNAACYAALALAGKDEGTRAIDEPERARLRGAALGWLRDDLAAWTTRLDDDNAVERALVAMKLRLWQQDADLAAVRDAIDKMPKDERPDWRKLWQDVDTLLKRAVAPSAAQPQL